MAVKTPSVRKVQPHNHEDSGVKSLFRFKARLDVLQRFSLSSDLHCSDSQLMDERRAHTFGVPFGAERDAKHELGATFLLVRFFWSGKENEQDSIFLFPICIVSVLTNFKNIFSFR